MWKYADWVLEQDELLGVQVCTLGCHFCILVISCCTRVFNNYDRNSDSRVHC